MKNKAFDYLLFGAAAFLLFAATSDATQVRPESQVLNSTSLESEIVFTSQPNCKPCLAFERDSAPRIRDAGWRIRKVSPDGRATPSFDIRVGGSCVGSKTGYSGRSNFFRWVKSRLRR